MILLQQPYVTIKTLNNDTILSVEWRGEVSLDDFRNSIDCLVDHIVRLRPKYLVIDTRKQAVLSKEATDYAVHAQSKITNMAIIFVLPDSVYTRMSVDMFDEQMTVKQTTNPVKYFQNIDDAYQWIETQVSTM